MYYITHVGSDAITLGQPPQQNGQPNAELGPGRPWYQGEPRQQTIAAVITVG